MLKNAWQAIKRAVVPLVSASLLLGAAFQAAALSQEAAPTPANQRAEIIFVESDVADYQQLLHGFDSNAEVHVLNAAGDGLAQMAQVLAGRNDIDAIHLVSHGTEAALQLGSLTLTAQNLPQHAAELATIRRALNSHADILLYGCNVAAGSGGTAFVSALAQEAHAVVAASTGLTGDATQGGNWTLEYATGKLNTATLNNAGYRHTLAPTTANFQFEYGLPAVPQNTVTYTQPTNNGTNETMVLVSAGDGLLSMNSLGGSGYALAGSDSLTSSAIVGMTSLHISLQSGHKFDLTSFMEQDIAGYGGGTLSLTSSKGTIAIPVDASGIVRTHYVSSYPNASYMQGITSVTLTFTPSIGGAPWMMSFDNIVLDNINPVPTVSSISPTSGPVAGGTSVTITGANFTGTTAVTIGGAAATSVTVNSDTSITATTPAGTAGARDVVVTTPVGSGTGTGLFTYLAAPTVTGISPSIGVIAGGTTVTISGTSLTGTSSVTIGGVAATGITVVNATTITATAPAGTAGARDVVVTTPGGSGTGTGLFTYIGPPTVTSVSASSGPAAGGTSVIIYGTNLNGTTAVTIGGAAATGITPVNATTVIVTTPAGTAGARDVVVTAMGGTGTGIGLFTYIAAPVVTGISPNSGSTAGGSSVSISGTNFTGATTVMFGATAASSYSVNSATSITASAPAGTGTVDITVVTPGGTSATGAADQFTYVALAGAPTGVTATAGNAQATVNFTAPASNGGSAITTYTATSSPGGLTGSCAGPAACAITVSGLTNGTAYTFTVTATNSAGTGNASSASNSVTPKASQTITFNNPGAQTFGTAPTLSATASSGLTPSFTSSTTGVCTITSGGALTFATAGTCTINADQAGNGSFSAASTVTQSFTVNAIVPGTPTIGTATSGDSQASVSFTAPTSNGGASITGYTVTSSPGGLTGTGSASPIIVTGLTNGTAYTFTVTATNSAGVGSASSASNAITPSATQTITFANHGAQNFGTTPTLTATATSGLTVSFTSSTTGVCSITSGGALTFVTSGTCTINADQAGNGSFGAASTVTQSFTVNAVVPGAPTIGTATTGDTQASITFTAPAFNGGAGITGYTVTSNPGGLTGTGSASPIIVTGLTNGTAYTFTVTATNSAGTGSASSASNAITPFAKLSQTITFANPGAQNFGATPTLTATATSALAPTFTSSTTGVCTITSGGLLTIISTGTCTINADQAGNVTYLAAATVSRSFTINAVVSGAPTGVTAAAGISQATINFTAPASNGGAAITTYTATSSPGGLTGTCAGPAACAITVSGLTNGTAYTFTVTATNAVGIGAASAASNSTTPQAVVPDAPTSVSATAGNAQATVTFTAPASNGGSTITGYTVISSPAGGVDSNAGTTGLSHVVTGLTNGTAYTFTVKATNAVGISAASAASNAVTPLAVVPGAPTGVAATPGNTQATVTFVAPASNGGSAITGYTVTSSPAGGVDTNAGTTGLSHVITGLTNGTAYIFTVTAANAVGTGAASAASNAITPSSTPTASAATMQFQLNTPVTLDLASFITGSSINVVVAPKHGTTTVNGTQVTYLPAHDFFGVDTFSYVAVNGGMTSAVAAVTVNFAGQRPDPTRDVSVTGMLNQQRETSKRFSRAQIANFHQRLESLHHPEMESADASGSLAESANTPAAKRIGRNAGTALSQNNVHPERSATPGEQAVILKDGGTGIFPNLLTSSLLPMLTTSSINLNMASLAGNERPVAGNDGRMHLWGAGNVRIGTINQQAGSGDIDYTTNGISFGADRRFGENLTLGVGVGYAHDKSTIGTDGSESTANGNSIVGYGSYQYTPKVFIDALLGYGSLNLDSKRYVAAMSDFAKSSRSGSQIFGSLSSGYEYHKQSVLISPYARYDFSIDRLDAVTESGAGSNALNYASQTNKTQQVALGLRAESMLETDFGALLPKARVEYQHHIEGNSHATVAYADMPGASYTMAMPSTNSNHLLLGVGSNVMLKNGLGLELNYQWMHSAGSESSQSLFFGISKSLGGK